MKKMNENIANRNRFCSVTSNNKLVVIYEKPDDSTPTQTDPKPPQK